MKTACRWGLGTLAAALAAGCSSGGGVASDPGASVASSGSISHGLAPAGAAQLLSTHVPDPVAIGAVTRVGAPAADTQIHLTVSLPLSDEAGLDTFLAGLYDPASPIYKRYLSVTEFTARFAPTAASYRQAAEFFRGEGLTVDAAAPNRILLGVDAAVADVERVFHVTLGLYPHPTEDRLFMAPDREPTLDLATPVLHVTGLDDFERPTARHLREDAAARAGTGSGPRGAFLGSDARAAYYGSGTLDGSGQSVGLMELEGYNEADVQAYFTKFGPPLTASVVGISTDGASLTCSSKCDDSEQVLDIEYSIAMAPGLAQVQVYVGKNAEDVLGRMASDKTSLQLSTSWGWGVKEAPTDEPLFKELAAQGQSLLTASGDDSSLKASGPWPEESRLLTAVGGTDLVTASAGGAWASETGWAGSAGGPSLDPHMHIEFYQKPFVTTANMASSTLRNVPDIAAVASNFYVCADGSCEGGYAGTSFASPIWTGFLALANQAAAAAGKPPVGFLNPTIYRLGSHAKYSTVLHDITSGKSGKFSAGPSFDLVTGLGSPLGPALVQALAGGS